MFAKTFRLCAPAVALTLVIGVARAEDKAGDIVETAVAGKFTKLVAAAKAAGLVETLKGKGPFTVFAPTDKAFEGIGEEKLADLLKDKETLAKILKYHVVAGKVMAKDALALAKDSKAATTVEGSDIKLSLDGDKLSLNGKATVTKADIEVSNGVIHVIDAVLLPPTK